MSNYVDISGNSGKTPFEACDDQYFYCTNGETSMLGKREAMAPEGNMQMGYTQLYFLRRLVLWNRANGAYLKYPDAEENFSAKDKFFVIGDHTFFNLSKRFSSFGEAEEYLKSQDISDNDSRIIIARLIQEEYWH